MKIKNNKGYTGVDVAVAVVILMIFISTISALFYNLSFVSKRLERKTVATNMAVNIIETMKIRGYSNLKVSDNLSLSDIGINMSIPNGYKIKKISVEDYKNLNKIKVISVEIGYTLKSNEQSIKIETLVRNV